MAMATGGAGASALIMALNSAKTVKSTKAMLDNTKELNKAMENGALQSFNQMLSGLQNTGPIQSALSVLFAQIQAGTTQSTVELMKSLINLFTSESFIKVMNVALDIINLIIHHAAMLIDLMNKAGDNLDQLSNNLANAGGGLGGNTPPGWNTNPAYVDVPTYHPGVQEY